MAKTELQYKKEKEIFFEDVFKISQENRAVMIIYDTGSGKFRVLKDTDLSGGGGIASNINIEKVGGTAVTGRDWSQDFQQLQLLPDIKTSLNNLDTKITKCDTDNVTVVSELAYDSTYDLKKISIERDNVGLATESTLSGIKSQTDKLTFDASNNLLVALPSDQVSDLKSVSVSNAYDTSNDWFKVSLENDSTGISSKVANLTFDANNNLKVAISSDEVGLATETTLSGIKSQTDKIQFSADNEIFVKIRGNGVELNPLSFDYKIDYTGMHPVLPVISVPFVFNWDDYFMYQAAYFTQDGTVNSTAVGFSFGSHDWAPARKILMIIVPDSGVTHYKIRLMANQYTTSWWWDLAIIENWDDVKDAYIIDAMSSKFLYVKLDEIEPSDKSIYVKLQIFTGDYL